MRVLLLSHCVPFADYRHHRQSGAAPIPVAVSEVCGSLTNARIHSNDLARADFIYDRALACQLNIETPPKLECDQVVEGESWW